MPDDRHAIEAVVRDYVVGMTRGDRDLLLSAFHSRGASVGHFDGALEWMSVPEFADSCVAEALPADVPIPDWEIEELRISGDTAVVIVTNAWAGYRFRDILTLLRQDSGWAIVFKCFHHLA